MNNRKSAGNVISKARVQRAGFSQTLSRCKKIKTEMTRNRSATINKKKAQILITLGDVREIHKLMVKN